MVTLIARVFLLFISLPVSTAQHVSLTVLFICLTTKGVTQLFLWLLATSVANQE